MRISGLFYSALITASDVTASGSGSKVKLSNVQSLTLRRGLDTSHRRVEAIPQLKCIGGSANGLYSADVMSCKNSGSDYDEDSVQWTCTAALPEEFKLGSTEVICEGYDHPEDPYILKGSCGVQYHLVLTEKGQQKYAKERKGWLGEDDETRHPRTMREKLAAALFWFLFIGVVAWMFYRALTNRARGPVGISRGGNWSGWGGGGGGGGGGWGGGNDPYNDPPPPYSSFNPKPQSRYGAAESWRPGFWSGALGGAATGYVASRMGNRNQAGAGSSYGSHWNNGEGSSRSSSSSSYSSTRYESTGFGSTSRR